MFSYLQQYHQTRRRPSLLLRCSLSTTAGRVVQEAAEGAAAERVIVARVEDEFVPEIVGDLRRHRDVALAAHQIGEEELPQAARDQRAVLALEAGMMLLQPLEQPARPAEGADEFGAPQRLPLAVQSAADERTRSAATMTLPTMTADTVPPAPRCRPRSSAGSHTAPARTAPPRPARSRARRCRSRGGAASFPRPARAPAALPPSRARARSCGARHSR